MVWLYTSPILVGRRGYFTCSNYFYQPSLSLEGGGGGGEVSTLWSTQNDILTVPLKVVPERENFDLAFFTAVNHTVLQATWKLYQKLFTVYFEVNIRHFVF